MKKKPKQRNHKQKFEKYENYKCFPCLDLFYFYNVCLQFNVLQFLPLHFNL